MVRDVERTESTVRVEGRGDFVGPLAATETRATHALAPKGSLMGAPSKASYASSSKSRVEKMVRNPSRS